VGESKTDAWQPKVIVVNGIRIGFIGASYSSINDGGVVRNRYIARIEDAEFLEMAIGRLKTESDFIVVAMHAGVEYTRKPSAAQVEFARRAVKEGADLVIGAHPHWVQTFEKYRGKFIFYSLGNFIFDQREKNTREGLTLRTTIVRPRSQEGDAAKLRQIELIPVIVERFGVPRRATASEAKAILKKIGTDEQVLFVQ
jgi:poly-gamma-glutamate synthesis protein (capsule biosynthesis protein)